MKRINKIAKYFFTFEGKLNQKKYILHYFYDLFFFIILFILIIAPVYIIDNPSLISIKILGLGLLSVYIKIAGPILLLLFIMNRLSIAIRRASYLNINKVLCILTLIPIIGILFDIFLFHYSDNESNSKF